MEELINSNTSPAPYAKVLMLATIVRQNVTDWRKTQSQRNEGQLNEEPIILDLDG